MTEQKGPRLVCACGQPIPSSRYGSDHCSTKCETAAAERLRAEATQQLLADAQEHISEHLRQEHQRRTGEASPAAGMLHLLNAEPTLLPEAPNDAGTDHIDHRRLDTVHSCLRCGNRAHVAYIMQTELGNRWLDLCADCNEWLIRADHASN